MIKNILSLEDFENCVKSEDLVIIEFAASWFPACRGLVPKVQELANTLSDTTTLVRVDVDANTEAKEAAGVVTYPTYQFYKGGEKVYQIEGPDLEALKSKI
jgi:thioredoxin 1